MEANAPSPKASPQGRRVLAGIVTGEAGALIQGWRERNDPVQAIRIPPHTTLCYWVPDVADELLSAQVRHAFPRPIPLKLGTPTRFDSGERSMYLPVSPSAELDSARIRLYDAQECGLGEAGTWLWHVTCVRDTTNRPDAELDLAAAHLPAVMSWTLDTIECLELRGDRYECIQSWALLP